MYLTKLSAHTLTCITYFIYLCLKLFRGGGGRAAGKGGSLVVVYFAGRSHSLNSDFRNGDSLPIIWQ